MIKNVIITGCGRSGTSMLAGTLANESYFIGTDYIRPHNSNPKGFFEGREINAVNDKILERIVDTRHPSIGYILKMLPVVPRLLKGETLFRGHAQLWLARVALVSEIAGDVRIEREIQSLTARQPFCFKDPRFCYTLPVWLPYIDTSRTVFLCIFRHPADTVESILRECNGKRNLKNITMTEEIGGEIWQLMYSHVLEKHRFTGRWEFIHFNQFFSRDYRHRLEKVIGTKFDDSFPEKTLYRSRGDFQINAKMQRIYDELCALAKYDPATIN